LHIKYKKKQLTFFLEFPLFFTLTTNPPSTYNGLLTLSISSVHQNPRPVSHPSADDYFYYYYCWEEERRIAIDRWIEFIVILYLWNI